MTKKTNPIYELADIFEKLTTPADKETLNNRMTKSIAGDTPQAIRLHILSLIDDCIDAASLLDLREERTTRNFEFLIDIKDRYLMACSCTTVAEFNGKIKGGSTIPLLFSLGDTVDSAALISSPPLDRSQVAIQTEALLQQIEASEWNADMKKALRLQLNSFLRILRECSYLTDDQVRFRIKQIFADFSAEVEGNFPPDKALIRSVLKWAKVTGIIGTAGLGLLANSATVAGYIEDHSTTFLIQDDQPETSGQTN